jgi:phosphoribosyl 1,2-cyclic phosphodiesterase
MELNDTIDFLKENYTNDVKGIVLLHLSSTNINPNKARKKVQEELGFENVFIAKKGLTLQLESDNF